MTERYEPTSDFLMMIINGEVALTDNAHARTNVQRLIAVTRDQDPTNRDWATMLLADLDLDSSDVRRALLEAADDSNDFVRGEAIWGLAARDMAIALSLVLEEMTKGIVTFQLLEAAMMVAHPALVPHLELMTEPSGHDHLDDLVHQALEACKKSG